MLSHRNEQGRMMCDCTECAYGCNGDQSCGEGWSETQPGCKGCDRGRLLTDKQEQT